MQHRFAEESQVDVNKNSISLLLEDERSQLPVLHVDVHRYESHRRVLRHAVAVLPQSRWHCCFGGFGFQLPLHSHASVICFQYEQNHCKNNNHSYDDGSDYCSRTLIETLFLRLCGHIY